MYNNNSSKQFDMPSMKKGSFFFPSELRDRARSNIAKYDWADQIKQQITQAAQPWRLMSDNELWGLMFGCTIPRSWMVWSNGYCPWCKRDVPMYNWQIDAIKYPWKVRCPHCQEFFPKNDFYSFYRSGLDEHGIFDPKRANRSLLFNTEHPDQNVLLHKFGVDDGEGYVEGTKIWRFIGAYLVYGQWKQAVLGGIKHLATAYIVTEDPVYAHKAGVLLDRVADLYPTFDFEKQALLYEHVHGAGYVSVWHDACEETRELALAYDAVFEALQDDEGLVQFLSRKAQEFKLNNPKASFDDIQHNIEDGILQDALRNQHKITSNYPRTPIAVAIILSVLSWEHNHDEVLKLLDDTLQQATAVDGVTGEKGLAGYASFTIQGLANALALYARVLPDFLSEIIDRYPLDQTFRFHIDTWCLQQQYYPLSGDTGGFAQKMLRYVGTQFLKSQELTSSNLFAFLMAPSMYAFLWQLYELTGDIAFVQVLYHANEKSLNGLPHDLFADEPDAFQKAVKKIIDEHGSNIDLCSVNKSQWCLALLRSGSSEHERVVWLDYDSGGRHGHRDGMNLGLFAKGLDLMPDFGYPPVHYGGWDSPRARWYLMTAAHNTVVVDGKDQQTGSGQVTLWADEDQFQVVRASAPNLIDGKQYERTAILVDVSDRDFYVLDIFRVVGGTEHAKFMHSHFGNTTTSGLSLQSSPDYGRNTQMRNFFADHAPQPGWSVDWEIQDRYGYLPQDISVHLRYTDLTHDAEACVCEGWISVGNYSSTEDTWIPRVMVRRQAQEAPLASTFVSVIEPYELESHLASIRRLTLQTAEGEPYSNANVAVEITHRDGKRDLIIAMDTDNPLGRQPDFAESGFVVQKDWALQTDASLSFVRVDTQGQIERIALCSGKWMRVGEKEILPI